MAERQLRNRSVTLMAEPKETGAKPCSKEPEMPDIPQPVDLDTAC